MAKKVLITGSNGGFGKLTVETLLNAGHQVAASMRGINGKNKETAEALRSLGAVVVEIDVTSDESVNGGVKEAIEQLGGLDVVVNNAGVGVSGMQEHFTIEDWHKLFDVNVYGVQRVNRAVLPHLRSQHSGLIIYISSLLGRIALPFYGPYNASKWALEAMAENYRVELSRFGIENAIVEPGGFETTFFGNLIQPSDSSRNEAYGDFMNMPQQMGEGFGEALAQNDAQNPQKVADAILGLIEAPKGQKPFRTPVDYMGMGDPIKPYNDQLEELTKGIYGNFQIDGMLNVQ
ncbi:MAG: SDR family oxidoreductase [Ekhidna sp.]|uniref:SDR family oxidoreductase n=1 Tax=Ekhidna sp. TaxID=2608089 RepID=UPI0032EA91D6